MTDELLALGVESTWKPVNDLRIALFAAMSGDPASVAHESGRRPRTVVTLTERYHAHGVEGFLPTPRAPRRPGAASLAGIISGRLVEETWLQRTSELAGDALAIVDAREQDPDPGWDFEVQGAQSGAQGGFTVDVKLHSELFRESLRYTRLEPEDCVPLGIYKMLVARERQQRGGGHHVYAFLFRPRLASDVTSLLADALSTSELDALDVLFGTSAPGVKRQQRLVASSVVDRHKDALIALLDGFEFRAISTWRAVNLFLELVETRAPMLTGRGRSFGSTINMHYSWSREMTAWETILRQARRDLRSLLGDFTAGRK